MLYVFLSTLAEAAEGDVQSHAAFRPCV